MQTKPMQLLLEVGLELELSSEQADNKNAPAKITARNLDLKNTGFIPIATP
jgi:hypothetical protein